MAAEQATPIAREIASLTSDVLLRFLTAQRWFGAKGGAPANARVIDYVVLPWGDRRFAVARVGVDVGGVMQMYQLPLAVDDDLPPGVDARVAIKAGLYDATQDEEFRRGLADALSRGARVDAESVRWTAEPFVGGADLSGPSKVGSAEQSNTSIVFGDRAILKLFRLLKPGIQPDVEVTGFFTAQAGFQHTPALRATIRFESLGEDSDPSVAALPQDDEKSRVIPSAVEGSQSMDSDPSVAALPQDDSIPGHSERSEESLSEARGAHERRHSGRREGSPGEDSDPSVAALPQDDEGDGDDVFVAGMLQDFLPGSTDAWTYALERGKPYFNAPIDRDPRNDFVADAKRLGAITREMHEALASHDDDPAFAPEAATPEDVDRWAHRTQQSIRDALTLLARQLDAGNFPADRVAEAKALVSRRDHYLGWIDEIDDNIGDDLGLRTRVHGDYHLGQVLRTASGDFMIIDFEGEPSRSIEERREKTSPLRDVAGMLRSFAYAAATLAMDAKNIDPRTREIRIARWERDVRNAYLEGYLATPDEDAAEIVPEDDAHVRQLIALFEAEKAFYELAYELNNRPTWAWIPMRGISKLFLAAKQS